MSLELHGSYGKWEDLVLNPYVHHTECMTVVPPAYCTKSVSNRYLIERFCGVFVLFMAFMAGAARQAGDAYSSQAPGLTSGLQGVRECPP